MAYPYSAGQVLTAADLNADLGNSWTAASGLYSAGWADYGSPYPTLRYRKIADHVELNGLVQRTGATVTTADSNILTLPSGYRPASGNNIAVVMSGFNGSALDTYRVDVQDDGDVLMVSDTIATSGFIWIRFFFELS